MLWATAKRAGCRMLFSEDLQDGRRLGDVLFVNPFDPANRSWSIFPAGTRTEDLPPLPVRCRDAASGCGLELFSPDESV